MYRQDFYNYESCNEWHKLYLHIGHFIKNISYYEDIQEGNKFGNMGNI